jgi:hypothetical protein
MLRFPFVVALTVFATSSTAHGQATTRAPIRPLGAILARAPVVFDTLINVRGLSDGRVIVNDTEGLRLVVLDAAFTSVTVWSDTTAAAKHKYLREAVIIPVAGDSSVMVDNQTGALVMIDPRGNFGRAFALPKTGDAEAVMVATLYGGAAIDQQGRLIYSGVPGPMTTPNPGCNAGRPALTADSVSLLRANFESRMVDTLARIRFSPISAELVLAPNRGPNCWAWRPRADVLPYHGDQWAVLSDGTIAIVREQDYHVDWIAPDGKVTSTPKMPFDWRPITAEEKQRMFDSVTKVVDSIAALRPIPPNAPAGFRFPRRPVVPPAEIPDYYPPTRLGSLKVDFDGNLWIPPTTSRDARGGGLLYDVVNRKGEVIERVQLPPGRAIASFVPGGRVVLRANEGKKVVLELARVR